jgi:hypothetical protein
MQNCRNSLIYRLRNKGYRIDTRSKTVFMNDNKGPLLKGMKRLIDDYHFSVQTEMPGTTTCGRVYISGPIAHYDLQERMRVFAKAETRLRASGYIPVNPFKNGLSQKEDWRKHMRADIRALLGCQYIFFLPDWELSKGCKLELDVATSVGVKVLKF